MYRIDISKSSKRVDGTCVTPGASELETGLGSGRTLEGTMWSQRSVIDYSLQRRATLATLFNGGATTMDDVCDADPYTLRAAKHHGEPAPTPVPGLPQARAAPPVLRLR